MYSPNASVAAHVWAADGRDPKKTFSIIASGEKEKLEISFRPAANLRRLQKAVPKRHAAGA